MIGDESLLGLFLQSVCIMALASATCLATVTALWWLMGMVGA